MIYVIGMPFNERNDMLNNLESICLNNSSRIQTLSSPKIELKGALLAALNLALMNATSEPVANNVSITESFFDYLIPGKDAFAEIRETKKNYIIKNITHNITGAVTTIHFELPFGLPPNTTTEVTFGSDFALNGLPASITKETHPVVFGQTADLIPPSSIRYSWLRTKKCEILIPDNTFGFVSTALKSISGNGSKKEENAKKTGYQEYGLMAILCIVAMFAMMKRF
jgi:hypothetical protein